MTLDATIVFAGHSGHVTACYLARAGLKVCDMIRFWTMSSSDCLDEHFEHPVIKAYPAVSASIGAAHGPMSPGSACVPLHHDLGDVDGNVGAWGHARGGMGRSRWRWRRRGARSGRGVERILVSGGRATCVVLEGGEELRASHVICNMDVKRSFLKRVDEGESPDSFLTRVRSFKTRGSSGRRCARIARARRSSRGWTG